MPAPTGGLWPVLAEIAEAHTLDLTDARLIKFTNSAVFDLPRAAVVVKVAGSGVVADRIPTVIRVARWLEAEGFPAVRLVHGLDQPLRPRATPRWPGYRVAATGPAPTGRDLARLVRLFHALPPPTGLPPWDPLRLIRRRLAEAHSVAPRTWPS